MSEQVSYELRGDVAVINFDDGKANALSHGMIDAMAARLHRAETEARAVVLAGRPGRFSAGFDLEVMLAGPEQAQSLLGAGARLFLKAYGEKIPVVAACTGHALAAGAILLLSTDVRVGARGDFKIGLNEVAIGMPVPAFVVEMARDRLSKRHLTAAANLAAVYDPDGAIDAGFLDEVADDPVAVAVERAELLASGLDPRAFAVTRRRLRGARVGELEELVEEDLSTFFVPGS